MTRVERAIGVRRRHNNRERFLALRREVVGVKITTFFPHFVYSRLGLFGVVRLQEFLGNHKNHDTTAGGVFSGARTF